MVNQLNNKKILPGVLPYAVIFDMDGVIADTEPLHGACFIRAFSGLGVDVTLEDYRQAVTLGGLAVRDYYESLGGDVALWDNIKANKDSLLEDAVKSDCRLMPGIVELLESLRIERIPIALATSARRKSAEIILNHFGIWDYFDAIVTKEEAEAEKPDPEIFLIAARKLELDPATCVVIEDSPRGVIAAARAGMKCVAVPTHSTADGDFSQATMVLPAIEKINLTLLRTIFGQ